MGRERVNKLEKCISVSISLPPTYVDVVDRSGKRSEVFRALIENNLDALGQFSVEEAEVLRRKHLRAIIYDELSDAIRKIEERAIAEGLEALKIIQEENDEL